MGSSLAVFDVQVASKSPIKFECQLAVWFRRRNLQNSFKMAALAAIWISIEMIYAFFCLQFTPILPIMFRFNWTFGSEEDQNRF